MKSSKSSIAAINAKPFKRIKNTLSAKIAFGLLMEKKEIKRIGKLISKMAAISKRIPYKKLSKMSI
jgi:hypothetical protein